VSVEKGLEDKTVADLRDKFVSLGSFQSIDQKDTIKLMKTTRDIEQKSSETDTSSFSELNKHMNLIISEQKALLDEINSFIEDIRKIKKNF
jgi:NurA-like 5'-3' nuclease